MNIKRTIASMLTLALMTGYGAPLATVAMAEDEEELAMLLLVAAMMEEQEKASQKKKKKSSTKKSSTSKTSTKKSSESSAAPSYTLSDVTPYSGVVRTNGGALNMRKTASADSAVLMSLANGTLVTVNGKTSNGWLRINAGNQTGFVSGRYIAEMVEASSIPAPAESAASASGDALYYVIANPLNNFVNMRAGASTSTAVVGVYHYGAVLKVLGVEGEWTKVEDESSGKVGYIKSSQLQRTDVESEEDHG